MISAANLQADISKAQSYAQAFKAGVALVPGMMADAETLLPIKGTGSAKLAMVANGVQGALAWEGHAVDVIEAVWAKLEPWIATLVTLYTNNPAIASLLGMTVFVKPASAPAA